MQMFFKMDVLKDFATAVLESLFNKVKEEAATQVFSCEHCESFKNNFFIERVRWLLLSVW